MEDRIATITEITRALPVVAGRHVRLGTLRVRINRGRLVLRARLRQGTVYIQRQANGGRPSARSWT